MTKKKENNLIGEQNKQKSSTKKAGKISSSVVLGVLAVLGIAFGAFFWQKYDSVKDNPTEVIQQRNNEDSIRVIGKVKQLILISEEEAPTIARVEDPTELQKSNPEFYANVQAEDFLILFPSRAIVYRESENIIVNIAPIINTNSLTSGDAN